MYLLLDLLLKKKKLTTENRSVKSSISSFNTNAHFVKFIVSRVETSSLLPARLPIKLHQLNQGILQVEKIPGLGDGFQRNGSRRPAKSLHHPEKLGLGVFR